MTATEPRFERTKNYILRKIVQESILVPISPRLRHRDCLYVLNPTACAIYEAVQQGATTLNEIRAQLLDQYEGVETQTLDEDVKELLDQLLDIEALCATT